MISAGHRLDQIEHYTLEQIQLFSDAIALGEKDRAYSALVVARAAQADEADFKNALKELSDGEQ